MATRGVFCIIKKEDGGNHILVSERADGKGWNLPGGCQEEGETDVQTAIREAKEELGLDVEVLCPFGTELLHKEDVAVAYLCKVIGGNLTVTAEAKQHRFISSAETKDLQWAGQRTLCMVLMGFYQAFYWSVSWKDENGMTAGRVFAQAMNENSAREKIAEIARQWEDGSYIPMHAKLHGPFVTKEEALQTA